MSDLNNAERMFDDQFNLIGDLAAEPEKHNLYGGLLNLAKGLQELERKIDQILYYQSQQS